MQGANKPGDDQAPVGLVASVNKGAQAIDRPATLGMRERAHLFRGAIQLKSAPGKGTTVTVRIPLSSKVRPSRASTSNYTA